MSKAGSPAEGRRQELLEKLRIFEETADKIHPERQDSDTTENVARYREAIEELQLHLTQHLASREAADWPTLPDSPADISAYADELKTEHQELIDQLSQLARAAEELETSIDRADDAARLRTHSRSLALRIARHVGKEETPLGDYL